MMTFKWKTAMFLRPLKTLFFGGLSGGGVFEGLLESQNAFQSRHSSKINAFDVLLDVKGVIWLGASFKNRAGPFHYHGPRAGPFFIIGGRLYLDLNSLLCYQ